MRLTFLGTAAANAYPEAFCLCRNCERARALGGPSLRKRSAALINDDLLIDLGPDVMAAASQHGRPLTGVRYCLQTHAHADHLDPSHFLSRSPGYGTVGAPLLHFYASTASLREAARVLACDYADDGFLSRETGALLNVELHPVAALQTFTAGRYQVTAFAAQHDDTVEPLLYAIEAEGRCIFYGTDTETLPEAAWDAFHQRQLKFDVVILDHTYGVEKTAKGHMDARTFMAQAARMRAEGLLAEGARILATHIAHDGNPPHPELATWAAQNGYEAAYDGLTV